MQNLASARCLGSHAWKAVLASVPICHPVTLNMDVGKAKKYAVAVLVLAMCSMIILATVGLGSRMLILAPILTAATTTDVVFMVDTTSVGDKSMQMYNHFIMHTFIEIIHRVPVLYFV